MNRKKNEPELPFPKKIPKMPEGYYSGDKPNPNLRAFVERHIEERPYDPETDDYDVPAFDKPIETTKATAIYNMHTYWSKKPHDAIRQYIRHYTKPGDLVLDPFCGAGGTAIASIMEGRKTVVSDLSPSATFITSNSLRIIDCNDFKKAVIKLEKKIGSSLVGLFNSPWCDGIVKSVIYSERFRCSRCFKPYAFIEANKGEIRRFRGRKKAKAVCPNCGETLKTNIDERLGFVPAELHIAKSIKSNRTKKINVIGNNSVANRFAVVPSNLPDRLLVKIDGNIQPRLSRNLKKSGVEVVGHLFSKINIDALLKIEEGITLLHEVSESSKSLLMLALHSILYNCTRMYRYRLYTTGGGGFSGTYYIPHLSKCINPWSAFIKKCSVLENAINEINTSDKGDFANSKLPVVVSCECATKISDKIPADSVDYVFTDPPYGGTYHYGALNLIWETWRGCNLNWRTREIVISEDGLHDYQEWLNRMSKAMGEIYKVLKPGRCVTLCFHGEVALWQAVNDIMAEIGFLSDKREESLFIDTKQKSYNQLTGSTSKKRDLVINFRKPKPNELIGVFDFAYAEHNKTFNEKVRKIIYDYLCTNPGSTKDRIYDHVVSRMVRKGEMEAHDFDAILKTVAEEVTTPVMKSLFEKREPDLFGTHEIKRWYLKESELAEVDEAETASEDSAAEKLREFIAKRNSEHPEDEGVHYSDLFEHYIYAVKDTPRRRLIEFLPDYFYKTEQGTWRLPASEEEECAKLEARAKGLGRRIKRYIAQLRQGVLIPEKEQPGDATLAEWIRYCKRSGMYEQGRFLYEKGGINPENLPEAAMADVEEDYQVCVRMLKRGTDRPGRSRRRES